MKKKVVGLLLSLVFVLTACGSASEPVAEEQTEVAEVESTEPEEVEEPEVVEEEPEVVEEEPDVFASLELADDEEIFVNVFENYVLKYKPTTIRAGYSGYGSIFYYLGDTDGVDDCNFLSLGYFADKSVSEVADRSDYTALSSGDMFYPDSLGTEAYLSTDEGPYDGVNTVNHTIIADFNGGELQIFCPICYKEESTRKAMEQVFDDIIGSITNDSAILEEAKAQGVKGVKESEEIKRVMGEKEKTETTETTEAKVTEPTEEEEEEHLTTNFDVKYDLDRKDKEYWAQFGITEENGGWDYLYVLDLLQTHEPTDEWLAKHGDYLKEAIASIDKPDILQGDIQGDGWSGGAWNNQQGMKPSDFIEFFNSCPEIKMSGEKFIEVNDLVEVRSYNTILPGGYEVVSYTASNSDGMSVCSWLVSFDW